MSENDAKSKVDLISQLDEFILTKKRENDALKVMAELMKKKANSQSHPPRTASKKKCHIGFKRKPNQ